MRNRLGYLGFLLFIATSRVSLAVSVEPPPPYIIIHQTLENLWAGRKYEEITRYVSVLAKSWEGYVPVELTVATYDARYGDQVEIALARLRRLRDGLNADILAVSPIFMELLDSQIVRFENNLAYVKRRGLSREQRYKKINPVTKTKFTAADHWVGADNMLFFNTPEVFVTAKGIIPVRQGSNETANRELQWLDYRQLLDRIDATGTAMSMRKEAVRELVGRRAADGDPKTVAQGLFEARTVYTGHDSADALVKMGLDAVPAILEKLVNPAISNDDKMCAIWVLVRIGLLNREIDEALQYVSTHATRPAHAEYARTALRRLQEKNAGNSHSGDASQVQGLNHRDPGISTGLADESVNRTATAYDDPGRHNRGRLFRKAAAADAKKERLKSAMPTVTAVVILAVAATLALFHWHRKTMQRSK